MAIVVSGECKWYWLYLRRLNLQLFLQLFDKELLYVALENIDHNRAGDGDRIVGLKSGLSKRNSVVTADFEKSLVLRLYDLDNFGRGRLVVT